MTRISAFFTATKNRVRGMLVTSGKQFSLDSHFDFENSVGNRESESGDLGQEVTRGPGMKCAWIWWCMDWTIVN